MPSKNSRKDYLENGYYHIYNRGVEKRLIFQDQQDYGVFLSYLKTYLLPKDEEKLTKMLADPKTPWSEKEEILKLLRLNNFYNKIKLLAFCLMPNHFHLLIKQKDAEVIDKFMNSLGTRYTMYFNRKYARVGPLYQGVYKAVLVKNDDQLLHLSRYIHRQALLLKGHALQTQPCSYPEYLGKRQTKWVYPEEVLSYFSKENPQLFYSNFVREAEDLHIIKDLLIDSD